MMANLRFGWKTIGMTSTLCQVSLATFIQHYLPLFDRWLHSCNRCYYREKFYYRQLFNHSSDTSSGRADICYPRRGRVWMSEKGHPPNKSSSYWGDIQVHGLRKHTTSASAAWIDCEQFHNLLPHSMLDSDNQRKHRGALPMRCGWGLIFTGSARAHCHTQ